MTCNQKGLVHPEGFDCARQAIGHASHDLLVQYCQQNDLYAIELVGSDVFSLSSTGRKLPVKRLLGVLTLSDVHVVKCVGLSYMKHSKHHNCQLGRERLLIVIVAVAEEDVPHHRIHLCL